jgi:SpoVK/Ycf46/Vps4 family AAA+-type ATPase
VITQASHNLCGLSVWSKGMICDICRGNFDHLQGGGGGGDGEGEGDVGVAARVLSTFLNELDGVSSPAESSGEGSSPADVFVLAACADIDTLDKALCRPGRLSHNVFLDKPSGADIVALLNRFLIGMPVDDDVTAGAIALLEGFPIEPTPADISAICREAVQVALKESIGEKIYSTADIHHQSPEIKKISVLHFESALRVMYPQQVALQQQQPKADVPSPPAEPFIFPTTGTFSHGSSFR